MKKFISQERREFNELLPFFSYSLPLPIEEARADAERDFLYVGKLIDREGLWSRIQENKLKEIKKAKLEMLNWFYRSVAGYPDAKQRLVIKAKQAEIEKL